MTAGILRLRRYRPPLQFRNRPKKLREFCLLPHELIQRLKARAPRWLGQRDTLPTISALREHGNTLVEQVLAENSGRWESASPRDLARVEAIARAVMGRLLHEPTIRLRSLGEDRGHAGLEMVRELFALGEDGQSLEEPAGKLAEVHDLRRRRER